MSSGVYDVDTETPRAKGGWNPREKILQRTQNDFESKFEGSFARPAEKKSAGAGAIVDPFKKW